MKITHHWLQEFTPAAVTSAQLAAQLTLAGLEVESVTPVAPPFSGVTVGRVLACGRHPTADKLSVCEVTTDGSNRLQIVCGAANVRAGLNVAVALVGARLPGGVTIERAMLRGQESNGMLCSARELGLGDEHDGIMELDESLMPGADLRAALDLDDHSLEVNATPNRGDCMSVFGIARDHAAAQQRRYLRYDVAAVTVRSDAAVAVSIDAPAACPVLACRVVSGVRSGAHTPLWLRERLRRVGVNSISPIVDVTNYVMMELGQPMHAYDLQRLTGGITARLARAGERLRLLDNKEYDLDPDQLVIADDVGPIGLAGIMGGRHTAITDGTTDVVLEAAHFAPEAIAGRARRFGLFTDAAQRFERGVDPRLPALALERATALLIEIAGGEAGPVQLMSPRRAVATPEQTAGDLDGPPAWVPLRRARLSRLLGTSVPDAEVVELLSAIAPRLETTSEGWRVATPSHRFDLRIEADLIEEIARLRGFDRIEETPAIAPQTAGRATESQVANDRLLTAMVDRGYREIISYTFVDPALQRQLFPAEPALALTNPISADLSEMRVSLWSGLVRAARENLRRQQPRIRLFEMGNKFLLSRTADELSEVETLAGIAAGTCWPEQWGAAREPLDFYDIKGDLLGVLALVGDVEAIRFEADTLACLRPGRTARVRRENVPIGWVGEIHPQLAKTLGLPANTILFELEIKAAFASNPSIYKKISKFPSIRRDLAVVVDENLPLAALRENVTVSASGLLSELRVFDIYRGPGVDSGRKSVALGLILQDSSRTLTDVDADAVVASVVARLRDELRASIRDQ